MTFEKDPLLSADLTHLREWSKPDFSRKDDRLEARKAMVSRVLKAFDTLQVLLDEETSSKNLILERFAELKKEAKIWRERYAGLKCQLAQQDTTRMTKPQE